MINYVFFNQVDSITDMFNDVLLKRVITRPTEKPRSVGPHKSKLKTTTNKKKSCLKNKKIQECENATK